MTVLFDKLFMSPLAPGEWIGVDLDKTLAYYEPGYASTNKIGEPIPEMLARVKRWLEHGIAVRIVTARVYDDQNHMQRTAIEQWCQEHLGTILPVTCSKDFSMVALFDDRAIQVEANEGYLVQDSLDGIQSEFSHLLMHMKDLQAEIADLMAEFDLKGRWT